MAWWSPAGASALGTYRLVCRRPVNRQGRVSATALPFVSFNFELKLRVRASQRNRGLQCEKQRHRNATDMSLPLSGVDPTLNRRWPSHESDKKKHGMMIQIPCPGECDRAVCHTLAGITIDDDELMRPRLFFIAIRTFSVYEHRMYVEVGMTSPWRSIEDTSEVVCTLRKSVTRRLLCASLRLTTRLCSQCTGYCMFLASSLSST